MDWNFLSTSTPAINAWLNPSHRLTVAVKSLVQQRFQRVCRVMACCMTEALDVQGIHMPVKVYISDLKINFQPAILVNYNQQGFKVLPCKCNHSLLVVTCYVTHIPSSMWHNH